MREERRQSGKNQIRLEVKRSTELWLYSFADMYMIVSVLFIATTALYAKKARDLEMKASKPTPVVRELVPTAGRGFATAQISLAIEFKVGSTDLTEEAKEQLHEILPLLTEIKSGVVDIEGYADSRGKNAESEYASNLALSNERAVKVADWFIGKGISERKIRTSAFGSAHKFATEKRGPAGGMSDRRVVVKFYAAGT